MELDLLAPEVVDDPHPTFARLRGDDPVHWSPRHHAWILTRYDDVNAAFRDPRLSSDRASPMARGGDSTDPVVSVLSRWMVFRDPPDHTRMRRALRLAFTPAAIEAFRPTVEGAVDALLDGLPDEFEFQARFAIPLPAIVIAELLGVPPEDRDRFRAWSEDLATLVFATGVPDRHRRGREALAALAGYLGEQLELRASDPRDDLLTVIRNAADLTREEAIANAVLLLFAGHETTTTLLSNGLSVLFANREQLSRLQQDRSLAVSAIEEMLRFEGPSKLMPRWATEPVTIAGTTISAGELVYLVQAAANRDPARFAEPNRLDLGRDPNPHLAFGYGLHYCLGAPLARLEAAVALDRLLERDPTPASGLPRWRANLLGRSVEEFTVRLA